MLNRREIDPDVWQEEVLASPCKRKILNTSRQVGKSTVIAGLCLHKALFMEEAVVMLFAPTEKQAKEAFGKVARFYMAYLEAMEQGGEFRPDRSHRRRMMSKMRRHTRKPAYDPARDVRKMGLELPNGSRIEALPATDHSSRGFTADLLVIDEAAFAGDTFYKAIRPSIAVSKGEIVLASTPYGKRGFFYEEWDQIQKKTAAGIDPNWEAWEVPAAECSRIDPDFLVEEFHRLGERHFRQEYMCSFEETEDSVFSERVVVSAFDDEGLVPLWDD